jgi:prolyl oligopeptidase
VTYPPAPRGDDADVVHGVTIPDPFRRLEDPDDPVTVEWSRAQAELLAEHRSGWRDRLRFRDRLAELLAAGSVGTPAWRYDRPFFARRTADQEHAVLLTVDPEGTERPLVDPIVVDPSGATTLDTWQPSQQGDLLAYQLSVGGTEESVLRVLDVVTGQEVDGPIDRARYSPVAWLPDGKAYYYVRRLPADAVPAGEEQFHRRVYPRRAGQAARALS